MKIKQADCMDFLETMEASGEVSKVLIKHKSGPPTQRITLNRESVSPVPIVSLVSSVPCVPKTQNVCIESLGDESDERDVFDIIDNKDNPETNTIKASLQAGDEEDKQRAEQFKTPGKPDLTGMSTKEIISAGLKAGMEAAKGKSIDEIIADHQKAGKPTAKRDALNKRKCAKPTRLKFYPEMAEDVPQDTSSPETELICNAFRRSLRRGDAPRMDDLVKDTGLAEATILVYLEGASWIRKDDSSPAGIVVYLPLPVEAST
jgi:hypothetical protein